MRTQFFAFALLAVAALFSGTAQAVLIIPEQAIETSTGATSLPASANGVVVMKLCPACAVGVLRLNNSTRYLVGKSPVTYAELQKFLGTSSSLGMVVMYEPSEKTVTRIVVQGQLPVVKKR